MKFLYPSDPLNARRVDESYVEEFAAMRAAGRDLALFSLESFESGSFRVSPALAAGDSVVYRGWMLPIERYRALVVAVAAAGAVALTSVDAYRLCHHLPAWYPELSAHTAETVFLPEDADFALALRDLGWPGYFVKDYVKSLNTAGGSLVESVDQVASVVALMRKYRGFIEGGVCVRKRQAFEPGSERRFFVWRGHAFSAGADIPQVVQACAERIQSPFFSVDVATLTEGSVVIVELGDGQVSDRKEWSAERFATLFDAP